MRWILLAPNGCSLVPDKDYALPTWSTLRSARSWLAGWTGSSWWSCDSRPTRCSPLSTGSYRRKVINFQTFNCCASCAIKISLFDSISAATNSYSLSWYQFLRILWKEIYMFEKYMGLFEIFLEIQTSGSCGSGRSDTTRSSSAPWWSPTALWSRSSCGSLWS